MIASAPYVGIKPPSIGNPARCEFLGASGGNGITGGPIALSPFCEDDARRETNEVKPR